MSYRSEDARRQVLDQLAEATDQIGTALIALGEAYDHLDEQTADRLEEQLFRPVQAAYGRAQRGHAQFAQRFGLSARTFERPPQPLPTDPGHSIGQAADALRAADQTLATLQDSMLPVEVGDPALRADLSQVRELISGLPERAREIVRTVGR